MNNKYYWNDVDISEITNNNVTIENPPESSRSYSGIYNNSASNAQSMLDSTGWFSSNPPSVGQWMQIDLGSIKTVVGVITQGRVGYVQRVTTFTLQYSLDNSTFYNLDKTFTGNSDSDTKVTNIIDNVIEARYIRFYPQTWNSYMSMRGGVIVQNLSSRVNELNNKFTNFPGMIAEETKLTSIPSGFNSNAGNFNDISENNSWWCYHKDELSEAPSYFMNDENIFIKNFSHSSLFAKKKIIVKNQVINTGSGTINIPEWCNAVKFYFKSKNGTNGVNGNGVGAGPNHNYNQDSDHNFNHRGRGTDPNNHQHHNHNHHHHNNHWAARSGGAAGIGGTATVGWFFKYIKFTAGTDNTIEYSISTSGAGNSNVNLKSNNVTKAQYSFVNGGNGNNGTHATGPDKNHNSNHNYDNTTDKVSDDTWYTYHYAHNFHNNYGSTAGSPGSNGSNGTSTITNDGNAAYLTYIQSNNEPQLYIYYFKYQ